MKHKIF